MIRLLLLLLAGVCGLLNWWMPQDVSVPPDAETVPVDVCSEDPYYAQAVIALDWYAAHPEGAPNYAEGYSHAVLDSMYVSLFEQGLVPPVPPACTVTARVATPIYDHVGGTPIGELTAGSAGDLYGRSEDSAWWNVLIDSVGWGWVSAQDVVLQPGTQLDRIPIHY
jgi:hypothetical protein